MEVTGVIKNYDPEKQLALLSTGNPVVGDALMPTIGFRLKGTEPPPDGTGIRAEIMLRPEGAQVMRIIKILHPLQSDKA